MIKKLIILPLCFLLIHFLYITCVCNCPDIKDKYFSVKNIAVQALGSNNAIIDSVTTTDTISLSYDFFLDCVAFQKNPFNALVNSLYACSCKGCGDYGIKSKIMKFEITSDSVYNGIPANTSLNNVFRVKQWNYFTAFDRKTLDTVKTYVNNGYPLASVKLFSTIKPLDARGHRFTLTLITENNEMKTVTAKRIFWF